MNQTIKLFRDDELKNRIIKKTGGELLKCYNCGTCTAGCPVSQIRDFNPRRVLRKINLGLNVDEDIWPCVSCFTCNARCPNGIDIAKVMDALRIEIQKDKRAGKHANVIFNRAFLETVENYGQLYELGMLMKYKIKSGNLFQDIEFGLPLMLKGKMGLLPHKSGNAKAAREIFRRVREIEERDEK